MCGALVCSQASVCSPSGDQCVLPQQIDTCQGQADGDACSYPGVTAGACVAQVCLPSGCGNGLVETNSGEVCDDGNRVSFDGCSADCTSDEVCGDGVIDAALGELCDCGMQGMSVAGCTGPNSETPGATCRPDCQLARCGDTIEDPHEACDDGNAVPGDGCRADCGGRWTQMPTPSYADFAAVWGSSANNVFAVGGPGAVLHYDGTEWTAMTTPTPLIGYSAVWGSGNDVFAAGYNQAANSARIDRYDGTAWTIFRELDFGEFVSAIHGRSASDFWIAGSSGAAVVLEHYDGVNWTPYDCGDVQGLGSLWADPASDKVYGASGSAELCVFDGDSWAEVPAIESKIVWGASGTELYGLADSNHATIAVSSTDGVVWTPIPEVSVVVDPRGIGGVTEDIIIVGDLGRVLQFDGTTWQPSPTPVPFDLTGVWGYAKDRAFIVGENGTILY